MRAWLRHLARSSGTVCLLTGFALAACNVHGWWHPAIADPASIPILDTEAQTLSEQDFWRSAERLPSEADAAYADRLRTLVGARMLLVDPKHLHPGFTENWLLWTYAKLRGRFEWVDERRSIRMGAGFCSAHAMVYNSVASTHGLKSRIWALDGHVVNEVWLANGWQVVDADYGISFGKPLSQLTKEPETVYQAYLRAGRPDWSARRWRDIYLRSAGHRSFETASGYAWKAWLIESTSWILIWLIPGWLAWQGLKLRSRPSAAEHAGSGRR